MDKTDWNPCIVKPHDPLIKPIVLLLLLQLITL